jgi:hypothetical protein
MTRKKKPNSKGVIVVKNMRDYSNDPYFIKKAEKAKATIEKYGLPSQKENK